jgi:hypothetical protein
LYPVFATVQDKLGAVNDHATAMRLFDRWREAFSGKQSARRMQQLLEDENRRLAESCEAFRQWWTPQRARSLKNRFNQLLEGPPRRDKTENSIAEKKTPLTAASIGSALASSVST